jgi:hypothetical protein
MFAFVCTLAMLAASAAPASAQDQTKEKPPMYTYIANWAIPRAQWAQMDKDAAANQAMLEKLVADAPSSVSVPTSPKSMRLTVERTTPGGRR